MIGHGFYQSYFITTYFLSLRTSKSINQSRYGVEEDEDFEDISRKISMREQLALAVTRYSSLLSQNSQLKQRSDNCTNKLKEMQKSYSDLKAHCHLIAEDKNALFGHAVGFQ
jgi:hypothetical protein